MHDRIVRFGAYLHKILEAVVVSVRHAASGIVSGKRVLQFVAGAIVFILIGIIIALAVHSRSAPQDTASSITGAQGTRGLVRPVRVQDFRFPRMHIEGPRGDFFQYRDPQSAWSRDEVERLWLDLEEEAADIVREENSELLEELLNMRP